jgi:hypothetical protein
MCEAAAGHSMNGTNCDILVVKCALSDKEQESGFAHPSEANSLGYVLMQGDPLGKKSIPKVHSASKNQRPRDVLSVQHSQFQEKTMSIRLCSLPSTETLGLAYNLPALRQYYLLLMLR